jgi:hypothetical protein
MSPVRLSTRRQRPTPRRRSARGAGSRRLALAAASAALLAGCSTGAGTTDAGSGADASTETTTVASTNAADHDEPADHEWDPADEVLVTLTGDSAEVDGDGVTVQDGTVTVTAPGTYRLSGTLTDGQLIVDTADSGIVRLVLDGVAVTSSVSSAVVVDNAEEVMIVLADGSTNTLTDGASYSLAGADTDGPSAAVFSAADLTIAGDGALTVVGNSNDGIASKDGLVVTGGAITVDAVDDGIRGKDYVVVEGGTLDVTAGGDGVKSDNDADATLGYVSVAAGTFTVVAGGDGIDAATDALVSGGELDVVAGGGSGAAIAEDVSAKGIKGTVSVVVSGGTLAVDAADDALHSNGSVDISDGTLTLASGDDGAHADATLVVSGGEVTVTDAYEGLESADITIAGGTISLTTSDDGINVAGGTDGSGEMAAGDRTAEAGGPVAGGPGGGGGDEFVAGDYHLSITGGTLVIDADGDGLDSNGTVTMTGGTVVVSGPTEDMNGAIDVNGTFEISGGVLVAAGSSGMAETPDASSAQATLGFGLGGWQDAGSVLLVVGPDGTVVAGFEASKAYSSFVVSTPDVVAGESYEIYLGGSVTGDTLGGYSTEGDTTGATLAGTVVAATS